MRQKKNWVGLVFRRLTVISISGDMAKCQCSCGNIKDIYKYNLGKHTVSCGCRMRETARKPSGLPTETPTHNSWENMIARTTKTTKQYENSKSAYIGITVCDNWLGVDGFRNFVSDMGIAPKGFSIDRIDTKKGYYKENCKWACKKDQQNNMRRNIIITLDDLCEYTIEQAAVLLGKTKMQVWHMKNKGQLKWRYRYA